MKLRNKKTGEIKSIDEVVIDNLKKNGSTLDAISIDEIKEEWEDYEEPKEYWYIDWTPEIGVYYTRDVASDSDERQKEIGNYFETKEEAEKAVEKLKAWKRLKDKGFRLNAVVDSFFCLVIFMKDEPYETIKDDLKIVFGGEK